LSGRAVVGDLQRNPLKGARGDAVIASYAVNEIADASRQALLPQLLAARAAGAPLLIVEPIARRVNRWWEPWRTAFTAEGGREDEWRFRVRSEEPTSGLQSPRELVCRLL